MFIKLHKLNISSRIPSSRTSFKLRKECKTVRLKDYESKSKNKSESKSNGKNYPVR